jgi:hypothetical protein
MAPLVPGTLHAAYLYDPAVKCIVGMLHNASMLRM